jgi:hypothetical protein
VLDKGKFNLVYVLAISNGSVSVHILLDIHIVHGCAKRDVEVINVCR